MKTLLGIGTALSLMLAPAVGAEESTEPTKLDKALEKFTRTGEMENCINPRRIRDTRVVDDNHIIFRVNGKVSYLNTLPRKCNSLGFHEAIIYKVRGARVCHREIFHVLDRSSVPGPFCSFGKFEKLVKKTDKQENG